MASSRAPDPRTGRAGLIPRPSTRAPSGKFGKEGGSGKQALQQAQQRNVGNPNTVTQQAQ